MAVRADFYLRCTEHRGLAESLREAALPVTPMTADELREAVTRPAQAARSLVERDLATRIVEEVLDQPGALPVLSHALLETWRRRKGPRLTLAAYEAAGGVRGAIAATAEKVYDELSPGQRDTARRSLLRMIQPGRGTADTRRPLTRAELDDLTDPDTSLVVERLAGARLLTVDDDCVQIAHEALITGWPRLRGWIDQDRERMRQHRRLTEAARGWLEHDHDPGALYRGTSLSRAEDLFADHDSLTETEQAFLRASLDARRNERRAAARSARRSRVLVTSLSGTLAVALVVGVTAWHLRHDNERQRAGPVRRPAGRRLLRASWTSAVRLSAPPGAVRPAPGRCRRWCGR